MTSLFDPSRRRIGDIPALNSGKSGFVVPRLSIWPEDPSIEKPFPEPEPRVVVSAMVPAADEAGFVSRQVSATVPADALPAIVREFRANPERFLQEFFHITLEAPHTKQPKPASVLSSSAEGI